MLLAFVLGTEVALWCFLGAGLATRYLLRRKRARTVLLRCVPFGRISAAGGGVMTLTGPGKHIESTGYRRCSGVTAVVVTGERVHIRVRSTPGLACGR